MGQYLAIGIVDLITVSKNEMHECKTEQAEILEQIESTLYFPSDLYDVIGNQNALLLKLKNEIFESELIPFLVKFYNLMYLGEKTAEDASRVIETLRTTLPSDWAALAESKSFCCFQEDKFGEKDTLFFKKPFNPRINLNYNSILLSAEGKILMEVYGRQFNFMKYCMKETFKEFALAGALRIYITG